MPEDHTNIKVPIALGDFIYLKSLNTPKNKCNIFCRRNDDNPGICVIVKTHSYRHTKIIALDSERNTYY